jgi:hypothetical protein
MRAVYCICKNTYTIHKCTCGDKNKNSALFHGIGALTGQGNSTVTNTNTETTSSSDSTDYQL